ncbi:MAG: putative hydrolase, alpha/beta fold family protein [Gaiellaceae bacterium]|nr:MAG: putative hydrolase, alpha/beta fold family protein [Gaiellaceae bacterium]
MTSLAAAARGARADDGHWHEFERRRVWYRRSGAGRPAMVFLPNATLTWRLWEQQVEHFSATHDVIAVDLPGFGRSDRLPDPGPSLALYVRWLERFVADLELAPVVLVGNCLGSLTALHYAARRPEAVSALVLMHTLTREANAAGSLGRFTPILRNPLLRRLARRKMRRMPLARQRHFPYVRDQLGSRPCPSGRAYLDHVARCYAEPETRLAQLRLGRDFDNWVLPDSSALAGRPPLCWIWGDANRLLPLETGRRQVEALAPEEVHVLEGCGYAAPQERPGEVTRIIERFLALYAREAAGRLGAAGSNTPWPVG